MAGLNGGIVIRTTEYRPCIVQNTRKALFHRWTDYMQPVEASLLKGGVPAGQISKCMGIVELDDGKVEWVYPEEIKFLDSAVKFKEYIFDEEKMRVKKDGGVGNANT